MVPPIVGMESSGEATDRYPWLTSARLTRVRGILLGTTLFCGLVVWVFHSLGTARSADPHFIAKLRGVGALTWLYAIVQLVDLRFYNSKWARKRRESIGIPDSLHAWLFGQMLACFGILYYGLTEDLRWYVAGLAILAVTFVAFPVRSPD